MNPSRDARTTVLVSAGLSAVLLAALILIHLANPMKDGGFNADWSYFILLTDDLLFRHGRLSDWYVAPHYYLFPDVVFSAVVLAAQRLGVAPLIGSVALFGALWIAVVALLWRRLSGHAYLQSLPWAALTVVLAFAACCADGFHGAEAEALAQGQLLFPALHGGALALSILCAEMTFVLIAPGAWTPKHWILLAGLGVSVALVTLSDLIFVPWGLVPLAIIIASRWRHAPVSRLATVTLVLLVAAGLGYSLSLALGDEVRGNYVGALRASASAAEAARYLWQAAAFSSLFPAVIFYANVALWIAALLAFRRECAGEQANPVNQALILLGALSLVSIVAPVAFGIFRPAMVRIFLPYLFIGNAALIGFLLWTASRLIAPRRANALLALAAGTTLVLGAWLYRGSSPWAADDLASCLSDKGLVSGVASYWQAAPVILATRHRIHVVALDQNDLKPFRWMTKRQWLSQTGNGAAATVEFAVTGAEALPEEKVRALFGAPTATLPCGGATILLYQPAKVLSAAGNE